MKIIEVNLCPLCWSSILRYEKIKDKNINNGVGYYLGCDKCNEWVWGESKSVAADYFYQMVEDEGRHGANRK